MTPDVIAMCERHGEAGTMFLIEIAHPAGRLDDDDRRYLRAAIIDVILSGEKHPEETNRRARDVTHIAFRELQGWSTGHGTLPEGSAPPMVITLSMPQAWSDEAGPTFIGLLRTAVRRLEEARGWERSRGSLWVRVDGVADGDIGLDGYPSSAQDVLDFVTEDFRAVQTDGDVTSGPPGRLIDPTCGMSVPDVPGTITLEHDGARFGFCAHGCRDAYARRAGIPLT